MRRASRTFAILAAAPASLLAAEPAFAQNAQDVTFFKQFLVAGDAIGMAIIWLLVALSAVSIGYAASLFLRYRKATMLPESTQQQISDLLRQKKYREAIDVADGDPSFLGRVVHSALGEASAGYEAMERAIQETGDAETARILRPLEYLNVLGNIAPMLGLFGTVYGMIRAFQQLVATGGDPDPAALAAGISTALVTTFWGLIVAMPALAAYALIRNRVDAFTSDGILLGESMIAPFKPRGERSGQDSLEAAPRRPRPRVERSERPEPRPDRPDKPG
jgi:biopolymer transport protein ExbB